MGDMAYFSTDVEMRHVVNRVTLICLSAEFQRLQAELLNAYLGAGEPDAEAAAFRDALFSLMAERSSDVDENSPIPGGR